MKDTAQAFTYDLGNLDRSAWMARVDDVAEEFGHAEPVGPDHTALLVDAGRTLLVSFESVAGIRKHNDDAAPLGWGFVQSHGWSSLTVMANAELDWFRHPAVYGYFDHMIDDGFFDDFDQILFYGAGKAAYAAAAFSVAAPETRVLVIQPQATLDPARTRWDQRFPEARRLDFTSRFGFAPMMVDTAERGFVLHDPSVIEDAMHASLFDGANTEHFTCPYLGPDAQRHLMAMDMLPELIENAMSGDLSVQVYAQLWRARRTHLPYLRTLMHRLDAQGHHEHLLARLCRHVSDGGKRLLFAKKLAELESRGISL
jgi:hypothetical protein